MADFQGKYTGNDVDARLDKIKDMVEATASQDGGAVLIPTPVAGDQGKFLRGDGTWQVPFSGSYNDLSDKPNVVIKNEDEDAAMAVLVELVKNVEAKNYTCTQDQYDTLKALFKDATKNTCRVIKPSTDFVILHQGAVVSNVVVIYDYEDSKAFQILFDASMEML